MPIIFWIYFVIALFPTSAHAYIDPATGNAFFTLAITIVSSIFFGIQYLYDHTFVLKGFFRKNKKNIPLLLYSEGNQYWSFFEPILDELEKRKIQTQYYTSGADDLCFTKNYQYIRPTYIGKGNKAYAKMAFVRADIVLMTTPGLDVYQLKRSKCVKKYVHFYHALSDNCCYRLFGTDYYDTLLIDNEINATYIRELEQKRNLPPKELVVVGNIRLDSIMEKVKKLKLPQNTRKTILLSPSWGRESILYKCGEEMIDKLLETNYSIIIRPHPQMKIDNPELLAHLQQKYKNISRDILRWDFAPDNLPAMAQSDLMISDFSGIVFEYAFTFHKPVIMLSKELNLEQYDASDLSQSTWLQETKNRLGTGIESSQIKNIGEIIEKNLKKEIKEEIQTMTDKYWKHQGQCVENIVNYIETLIKEG